MTGPQAFAKGEPKEPEAARKGAGFPQASRAVGGARGQSSPLIDRGVIPILDRSRSRLRIPREILPEAIRQASREGLASPLATVRMETGGIIAGGRLDPIVAAMLNVIAEASLMLTIEVELEGDASETTIWATPARAVITSSLDPELVDVFPVRLPRLPETLTDVIMLRPPDSVAAQAITVAADAYHRAEEESRQRPDAARAALDGAGLDEGDVDLLLALQAQSTRRWRVSSTWATEDGQETARLSGFDAGARGQWLVAVGLDDEGEEASLTFSPQGDGDTLRALRDVLPRRWVGTPLTPRPTKTARR